MAKVRQVLDRLKPAVMILPEDNVEYTTGIFVREGHARGVPSIILPYTMANADEAAGGVLDGSWATTRRSRSTS